MLAVAATGWSTLRRVSWIRYAGSSRARAGLASRCTSFRFVQARAPETTRLKRTAPFATFVRRRAVLARDHAERAVVGSDYKPPRVVAEAIRSSRRFRAAAADLAQRLGRPVGEIEHETAAALDEMVAAQSNAAIEAWGVFGSWLSRAYELDVDAPGLAELRELGRRHALVFLPSHRSYLDPLVLRSAVTRLGFPLNYTLGGINVGFWPIGPVARRSGWVFIRRSFRGDEALQARAALVLDYLLRNRVQPRVVHRGWSLAHGQAPCRRTTGCSRTSSTRSARPTRPMCYSIPCRSSTTSSMR